MLADGNVAVLDTQSLGRLLKQLKDGTLRGVGALQVRNATRNSLHRELHQFVPILQTRTQPHPSSTPFRYTSFSPASGNATQLVSFT